MDLYTLLVAVFSIVIMDLVLAGDNAIVIGLAARNLPKEKQKLVIFLGTLGAIIIRVLLTFFVVTLLKIQGLSLIGGLLLIWIAYKLLVDEKEHGNVKAANNLFAAINTIILADVVMGLDNILAIAAASHGSILLVILGLMISMPIVVWGSTVIIKWTERFPTIIAIGSGVVAWTAAKMITHEPFLAGYFKNNSILTWSFYLIIIALVLILGTLKKKNSIKHS